jgi:hypothetical protein
VHTRRSRRSGGRWGQDRESSAAEAEGRCARMDPRNTCS